MYAGEIEARGQHGFRRRRSGTRSLGSGASAKRAGHASRSPGGLSGALLISISDTCATGEAKALAYAGSNGVEVAKQVNGRETKDNYGSSSSETRSMS